MKIKRGSLQSRISEFNPRKCGWSRSRVDVGKTSKLGVDCSTRVPLEGVRVQAALAHRGAGVRTIEGYCCNSLSNNRVVEVRCQVRSGNSVEQGPVNLGVPSSGHSTVRLWFSLLFFVWAAFSRAAPPNFSSTPTASAHN